MSGIASWALPFVGIPWKPSGRSFDGCDCYGIITLAYQHVYGISLPSYVGAYVDPHEREEISDLLTGRIPADGWRPVNDPRPGDAVVFRLRNVPWHVGVVVGPDDFLHVEESFGSSCVDRLSSARWARRRVGIYRHEALA